MRQCVLFVPQAHRLFEAAVRNIEPALSISAIIDRTTSVDQFTVHVDSIDLVISFLNPIIIKSQLLQRDGVNFHPAPPEYPGRGGASFALYEGSKTYGATAHRLTAKVDSGSIYDVARFPIMSNDTCETLFARGEDACLELLCRIMAYVQRHEHLPPYRPDTWSGRAVTRKEFERFLVLDPSDPASFERKIRACRHSRFPGPFVEINGHLFAYHSPKAKTWL